MQFLSTKRQKLVMNNPTRCTEFGLNEVNCKAVAKLQVHSCTLAELSRLMLIQMKHGFTLSTKNVYNGLLQYSTINISPSTHSMSFI